MNEQFSTHRSLAMGVSISGIGVGACIYPFIYNVLMDQYGWRGGLLISGTLKVGSLAIELIITLYVCVI